VRVYVASSWRNTSSLDLTIAALRHAGHRVYDFREDEAFDWAECDPGWTREDSHRDPDTIIRMLTSAPALRGFARDYDELVGADALVLVMPCGRSAHLELGVAIGMFKETIVFLTEPCEPELMWKCADLVTDQLSAVVSQLEPERVSR
jgi:hypothetical protein